MLFLTDDQLLQGIELMYFAYKGFTSDPDLILQNYSYGRAHHRAVHFINRRKGLKVNDLLDILGITKQSLNRVLRQLIDDGLVESRVGQLDKRERNLFLTEEGKELERQLSDAQRKGCVQHIGLLRVRVVVFFAEGGGEVVFPFV